MPRRNKRKPKRKPWHGIDPSLPLGEQLSLLQSRLNSNSKRMKNVTFLPNNDTNYDLTLPMSFTKEEIAQITREWCKEIANKKHTGRRDFLNLLMILCDGKTTVNRALEILKLPERAADLAFDLLDTL